MVLNHTDPYLVPDHIGVTDVIVVGSNDPIPPCVSARMQRSPARLGLRLAGGCSGMNAGDKATMIEYFTHGLAAFTGFVSSGATRAVDDNGHLDPMITDVPDALLHQAPNQLLTISTVPRMGTLGMTDRSRFIMQTEYGHVAPNPGVHMIIVVQLNNGEDFTTWDGDLEAYFNLFHSHVMHANWRFATIIYNGGGVTQQEAFMAAEHGWPVVLVQHSGRMADEIISMIQSDQIDPAPYTIVQNGDAVQLHDTLSNLGFIA